VNSTSKLSDGEACPLEDTVAPGRDIDEAIAELAARQEGVVGRAQLLELGLPVHVVDYRVRRGRLRVLHRGVYRFGPLAGARSREVAAVLACGPEAVVSHRSAARLWDLARTGPADAVDISVPPARHVRPPGLRVHRTSVPPDERTTTEGIAVTTVARTLTDLAGEVDARHLEQLLARADRRGLLDQGALARALARRPRRAGSGTLRALLARREEPALLRSEAEARFLAMVRAARLDPPEANALVRGREVDFLWRGAGLVVEIDGFSYHGSAAAFEGDRARDAMFAAAGLRVMRVTWRQLTKGPEEVLARVAQALVAGGTRRS